MYPLLVRLALALAIVLAATVMAFAATGNPDARAGESDCPADPDSREAALPAATGEAEPSRRPPVTRLRWQTFLPGAIR
ncbi:MAG: hypothetical protein KF823_13195 [Xanthomonadales bacterium]|nr:hypothetical protein [Xanthomonadales bacterium]